MVENTAPLRECCTDGCTRDAETVRGKYRLRCRRCRSRLERWGTTDYCGKIAPRNSTLAERIATHGWTERQVRDGMTPCHEWNGPLNANGYGKVGYGPRGNQKIVAIHRAVLIDKLGVDDLPTHVLTRHRCDNPPCINPDHLEPGTSAMNSADAMRRGRVANGERVGGHKLTDAQVAEIRAKYQPWVRGLTRALADEYGISVHHVGVVVRGQSRKLPTLRDAVEEDRALGVLSPLVDGSLPGDRPRGVLGQGRGSVRPPIVRSGP